MLRNIRLWRQLFIISMSVLALPILGRVYAQSHVEIRCGTFDTLGSVPASDFVGVYYYTTRIGVTDPQHVWEFGLLSQNGQQTLQAPFTPDLAQHVVLPRISPDGTKMVFSPLNSTDIVVWEITTGEVATFSLSPSLADYLRQVDQYSFVGFNKVVWSSSSELWIQYFGLYPDVSNPVLRIPLTVLDRPLRIVAQTDVSSIDLETLPASAPSPQSVITSPDGAYRLEVQERGQGLYTRQFQVYDARTNQVVLEVQSSEAARVVGNPMWSSDRNHIFYVERVPSGTKLVQLNANERFQRDTRLDTLLQNEFGSSTGVASTFLPILSRDGTHLGFGYLESVHERVLYDQI